VLTGTGQVALEGDATCFFHPGKKAESCCEGCGRFLCELCDMPLGARRLCPACLGSGLHRQEMPELISKRICWSRTAFLLGTLPLLIGWPVWPIAFVICGPLSIATAIYGWNKPQSLVLGRRRWTAIAGIIFGLLQIAFICGMVVIMWRAIAHAKTS